MKTNLFELMCMLKPEEICERTLYRCNCVDDFLLLSSLKNHYDTKEERKQALIDRYSKRYVDDYYYWTFEDGVLTLISYIDDECYKCEYMPERIYCLDMPRPEGFENVVKYHGITALSRTNLEQGIAHLVKVVNDPNYQTCCATVAIGAIGVILDGDVITASNKDLYSQVDRYKGGRYIELEEEGDAWYGIIHYADQLEEPEEGENNEMVTINNVISKVWVKSWAGNRFRKAAIELAAKYGVELIVIDEEEETYMWDDPFAFCGMDPDDEEEEFDEDDFDINL